MFKQMVMHINVWSPMWVLECCLSSILFAEIVNTFITLEEQNFYSDRTVGEVFGCLG